MASWRSAVILEVLRVDVTGTSGRSDCILLSGVSPDGVGDASWFDRVASSSLSAFAGRGEHPLHYLCHTLHRLDDMERRTPYGIDAALRASSESPHALRALCDALTEQVCAYLILLMHDVTLYGGEATLPPSYSNCVPALDSRFDGHAAFLSILLNEGSIRALFPTFLPQLLAAASASDAVSSTFAPLFKLASDAVPRMAAAPHAPPSNASALSSEEEHAVDMYPGGQVGLSRDVLADLNGSGAAGTPPSSVSGGTCLRNVHAVRPVFEVLAALCGVNRLVVLLTEDADSGWSPHPLAARPCVVTGKQLASDTFLGKLMSVCVHRLDFNHGGVDLIAGYRDLPSRGDPRVSGEEAQGDAGFDGVVEVAGTGLRRLVPSPVSADMLEHARTRLTGQLNEVVSSLRSTYNSYLISVRQIVDLLARKGGKDALFTWYGALIDTNADRSKMQYTHMRGAAGLKHLSSTGFVMNALHALLPLVGPFSDPADVKSAKIDLRYLSACTSSGAKQTSNGRFTLGRDSSLAPFFDGTAAGSDASTTASWIDPRNLARQQAYMQRQTAMVREAQGGAAAVTASPGGVNVLSEPAAPVVYTPIAEMYGLVFTLAHIGPIAGVERMAELGKQLGRARATRVRSAQELRANPRFGTPHAMELGHGYAQFKFATFHADMLCEMLLSDEFYFADDALANALFRLYRLHSVVMTRAACPPYDRHVTGLVDDLRTSSTGTPLTSTMSMTSTPLRGSSSASSESTLPVLSLGAPATPPTRVEAMPAVLPLPVPSLPLPAPKAVLCGLPEYALSDISEFLTWMGRTNFAPRGFLYLQDKAALEDYFKCLILYIASGVHVHNPYLRGNVVRAMQVFIPHTSEPWRQNLAGNASGASMTTPPLHRIVVESPIALNSVLPALSEFHVDIEHSGSHTAFYDKFNYRVHTSDMMIYLWDSAGHRATLCAYANHASTAPKFLRFANAIINDLAYEMEEALKSIAAVRDLERERESGAWASLAQQDVADKEMQLRRDESTARGMLQYAVQQAELMSKLTREITFVWLSSDKRAHVCAVLGFLLDQLAGEKRSSLAVRNKAALGFNPLELLQYIITIYNNLAAAGKHAGASAEELATLRSTATAADDVDILATAVVADGRSFHIENFALASELLRKQSNIVATAEARRLAPFMERLKHAIDVAKSADDAFGDDIPEEVADPIQSTLMRDPVLLPTSKQVMDRAVIMHWLLDQEQDPFNRQRLTASMLQPLPDLQAAIEAWMKAKKAHDEPAAAAALARAAAAKAAATDEGEDVDMAASRAPAAPALEAPVTSSPATPPIVAPDPVPAPASVTVPVDADMDEVDEDLRLALQLSVGADAASLAPAPLPAAIGSANSDGAAAMDDEDEDLQMAMQLSVMTAASPPIAAAAPPAPPAASSHAAVGAAMEEDDDAELQEALRMSMA